MKLFFSLCLFAIPQASFAKCDDEAFKRIREQVVLVAAQDAQMQALVTGMAEWGDDTTTPGSPTLSKRAAQDIALADSLHTYRIALEAYQAAYATICYAN